jgi:membrane protein DedA with SNARE-associated domain
VVPRTGAISSRPFYRQGVEALNDLILQAIGSPWLYPIMAAVALIDAVFPPIPSESVLVAAASAAVAGGSTNFWVLCIAAALGAIIGDNLAYVIGRWVGTERFRWMRHPRVASFLNNARGRLQRHGAPLILAARYIPGGRVAVNMGAGALGYHRRRFLVLTIVAGVTWAAYGAGIGTVAGHWFEGHPMVGALVGIGLAIVVGLLIDRIATMIRRRRAHKDQERDAAAATSHGADADEQSGPDGHVTADGPFHHEDPHQRAAADGQDRPGTRGAQDEDTDPARMLSP